MHATPDIDIRRQFVSAQITSERKSELGQFMTASGIAAFMANMFDDLEDKDIRLLDAGAGIGSLTVAFIELAARHLPNSLHSVSWEIDPFMQGHLAETLETCRELFAGLSFEIKTEDFILSAAEGVRYGATQKFTHAILNPPYKKLKTVSDHRRALRGVGIETSNLYAAFVALALLMLEDGGELVAITPRSFCNGVYFKPFRKLLMTHGAIEQVHIFEARNHAFKGDEVLQENIVFRITKGKKQGDVTLSLSSDAAFSDLTKRLVPFGEIVLERDEEKIIHLPTEALSEKQEEMMSRFTSQLADIGIAVSTGPVIDFRLKQHLRQDLETDCVPLVYSLHFSNGYIAHPKPNRKANAIAENEETAKWLMPTGHYVCVRRLSSKEEKRRIVPALFDPAITDCKKIGFDNHMNVFHENKKGLPPLLAKGLAIYLGSTFVDQWFRRFNGHTQVNAGDLRALRYPSRSELEKWGERLGNRLLSQKIIDAIVEGSV